MDSGPCRQRPGVLGNGLSWIWTQWESTAAYDHIDTAIFRTNRVANKYTVCIWVHGCWCSSVDAVLQRCCNDRLHSGVQIQPITADRWWVDARQGCDTLAEYRHCSEQACCSPQGHERQATESLQWARCLLVSRWSVWRVSIGHLLS